LANGGNETGAARPRTIYLLSQAAHGLLQYLAQTLAEQKITAKQYTVLSIVKDRQPVSSSELSRRFFVTPQSMNEVVASLEKAGLLSRTEDPNNRRVLGIRLTKAGRDVIARCDSIVDRLESEAFGSLPKAQLRDLRAGLRSVLDDVRHRTVSGRIGAEAADMPEPQKPRRRGKSNRASLDRNAI
jgi:DNA-binding MarR family transcriptional regulator